MFHITKSSLTNEETIRHRPQVRWRAHFLSRSRRCAKPQRGPCLSHSSQPPVETIFLSFLTILLQNLRSEIKLKTTKGSELSSWRFFSKGNTFPPWEKLYVSARCSTLAPSSPPPGCSVGCCNVCNIVSSSRIRFVILMTTSVHSDLKKNRPVWVSVHKVVVRPLKGF